MLIFLVQSRTAWNDFFTGNPTLLQFEEYGTSKTLSDTSVHVSNCLFRSTSSTVDGGALYCSNSVTYLLVESSSFISCKTSSDEGGAIYFRNSDGECVLHKVCGYDCCSTNTGYSYGQFVYTYVSNTASSKNYVNYSSIVRCVNEISGSYTIMPLGRGNVFCPSINSSMNKCGYYSGIHCYPLNDLNYVTCSISYSSFADNFANKCNCVLLNSPANFEIKSCNILRNTQAELDSYGTIRAAGNVNITDSCILENNANRNFHQTSSYTITLSNSTVDSFSSNGYLTTRNTVTKSFILALKHISTLNCRSEYDAAGTLSPIIQTPSPSRKQKHCCTCGNLFHQSRLRDFFSLQSVFLFNFVHLDVSGYPLY
jgi:hypothetical protein